MLTPTTAFAIRLAGPGAPRAALSSAFAKQPSLQAPCSCYAPRALTPTARPFSILAGSLARSAFRATPAPATTSSPLLSRIIRRAQSTTAAADAAADAGGQRLDWNSFFKLRKTRRRWQLAFSVVMLGVSGSAGAAILASGIADPIVSQIPLDPFLTLGFMVMGFSALGWLMGPSIGSAVFNTLNRQWKKQITLVGAFRGSLDVLATCLLTIACRKRPSSSHASRRTAWTPRPRARATLVCIVPIPPYGAAMLTCLVPDFYGENISSVAGYRQWLKDQRAFNKKRTRFV